MSLALQIRDLQVRGDEGQLLLAVESLQLAAGQSVAITGPSGAGKSTLLYALAGLLQSCSGSVKWGNTELLALNGAGRCTFRRDHIGLIFQDHLLFEELSALANTVIASGFLKACRRQAVRQRAIGLLRGLGIDDRQQRSVTQLSGGERQRVAVARALASGPAIILADEPTASLDRQTANRLIDDLLATATAGQCSLLLVTHDEQLQQRCCSQWQLLDGQLSSVGA